MKFRLAIAVGACAFALWGCGSDDGNKAGDAGADVAKSSDTSKSLDTSKSSDTMVAGDAGTAEEVGNTDVMPVDTAKAKDGGTVDAPQKLDGGLPDVPQGSDAGDDASGSDATVG